MSLFGVGAYYNEIDPYAAAWLRNLIVAGHISPGDVDTRSILDVSPDDLRGYTQCHFFAGIGVWSLALRRAGWSDDRPAWTGSCPCQPFSVAGVGAGFNDERHIWPHFQYLIEVCHPAVVIGEQVASKNADTWLDLVQDDMEGMGYAFGAIAFPSAGVGAPHIRDRTYWAGIGLADTDGGAGGQGSADVRGRPAGGDAQSWAGSGGGVLVGLAYPELSGTTRLGEHSGGSTAASWIRDGSADSCLACGLETVGRGPVAGFWRDSDWLRCRDDRWRPVEPGTFPLAHGNPGGVGRVRADQERIAEIAPRKDQGSRVGRLRGYGNAINAYTAQAFIESLMECVP